MSEVRTEGPEAVQRLAYDGIADLPDGAHHPPTEHQPRPSSILRAVLSNTNNTHPNPSTIKTRTRNRDSARQAAIYHYICKPCKLHTASHRRLRSGWQYITGLPAQSGGEWERLLNTHSPLANSSTSTPAGRLFCYAVSLTRCHARRLRVTFPRAVSAIAGVELEASASASSRGKFNGTRWV